LYYCIFAAAYKHNKAVFCGMRTVLIDLTPGVTGSGGSEKG